MKYLSFLLLILIINCSQKESKIDYKEKIPQQNVAFLIDNSLTMISKDFEPNRITVIKKVLEKIINNKKENQAFSLVVFAGQSYILCPLTKDKKVLLSALDKIDFGILKLRAGTNFSNPLLNGIASLNSQFDNKSMIIFSDGRENQKSYSIDIPIEDAIKNKIKVNTIIITPKDFQLLPTQMDNNGNIKFTKMKTEPEDFTLLKKVSSQTGGSLHIFHTKEELNALDFEKLISENKTLKITKNKSNISNDKLSKIYKEIEMTNDSLAVIFK